MVPFGGRFSPANWFVLVLLRLLVGIKRVLEPAVELDKFEAFPSPEKALVITSLLDDWSELAVPL